MQDYLRKNEISLEIINAIFIVAFVGLFLIANYFFGFSLPLYLITMIAGSLIAIRYPHAGLYAIVFLTFIFERFFALVSVVIGKNEYKIYPIDVLLGAVILGIIFQIVFGTIKLQFRKIDWLLLLFVVLSGIYFLISVFVLKSDTALAFSTAKNYSLYALFYFVTYFLINNKKRFKEILSVVFAGAIGILWFVFYGLMMRHGLWSDFTPLSTEGVRTLAFTHGYYLCMATIAALVYVAYQSNRFSKLLIVIAPFWAIGIIGSMMRHLWIGMFLSAIFLIAMLAKNERKHLREHAKRYTVTIATMLIVVLYGATLFPHSSMYKTLSGSLGIISERVTSITNATGDQSIAWRTAVWQESFDSYLGNPIFGIGFGKKVSVETDDFRGYVEVRNTHNSFLVILVQMGIVGFGLIFSLIAILGWKVFRNKSEDEFWQMSSYITLGILIFHLTSFLFQPYLEANLLGIFFWINLGVIRRIYEEIIER